jgi:LmbE family N-acetylglucosaminyl deacetylase
MNILAIGAHPDDIEYGCGGTLFKYSKQKHDIHLLVLTAGEMGGDIKTRKKEQEKVSRMLGVKKIFWGNFKDTEIPQNKETISVIEEVIKKVKADEIYVNYFDDTHQDHRVLASCAITATRYIKKVLFYEDYTTRNFDPDIFVDIGDVLEEKVKLLKAHRSQVIKEYPTGLDMLDSVRAIANFRGFQGKVKYAEGFKSLRYMIEMKKGK